MSEYRVGQKVIRHDGRRDPQEVEVVKVGRVLIHVQGPYGRVEQYRTDTRGRHSSNDEWALCWIETPEARDIRVARDQMLKRYYEAEKNFTRKASMGDLKAVVKLMEAVVSK